MSVGQELLAVPFPQMVRSLAMAIADGQRALDRSSVDTARLLARERADVIEEIHEVITPRFTDVDVGGGEKVRITGATVDASSTPQALHPSTGGAVPDLLPVHRISDRGEDVDLVADLAHF